MGLALDKELIFRNQLSLSVKKVPQENMENLKNILGITTQSGNGKYLGIPEQLQGSKTQAFAYVQNNLH